MPISAYRVGRFSCRSVGAGEVATTVQTYSLGPGNTDIERILSLTARSVQFLNSDFRTHTYTLSGVNSADVRALLSAHQRPRVTLLTRADLAVALDFYKLPPDRPGGSGEWEDSEVGTWVNLAKYRGDDRATSNLIQSSVCYVQHHPLLAEAKLVAAMPGSGRGPAHRASIAEAVAGAIATRRKIWRVQLERVRAITPRKNEQPDTDDQKGTMRAQQIRGGSVLLIDDAVRHGETIAEACRALRAAGASRVYSLNMAKDWTGTRGYLKDDL